MTRKARSIRTLLLLSIATGLLNACASFNPVPLDQLDYMSRAETQQKDGVTVTVTVMTRKEARQAFGKKLDKNRVQPVWIEIVNNSDKAYWLMLHGVDPDYYSVREAASVAHVANPIINDEIDEYYDAVDIEQYAAPGTTTSGFMFSNLQQGTKEVRIRLLGEKRLLEFEFFITVPGLKADWQRVDFQNIYTDEEIIDFDDPLEFRKTLEDFLCCTTKKDGSGSGDPINMVVIGDFTELSSFIRAGWDETEIIDLGSSWRTFVSFITGGEYKTSPISALYVYGRPQDISLQKARDTIHERNHLRLWLSPWRFQGKRVWVGGISRDIGVFWTTRTWNLTSHAIDSEIDEARNYLLEDLATSESLEAFGFINGVGETFKENPKENLLGTPWWTDGRRTVFVLTNEATALEEIELLDWNR